MSRPVFPQTSETAESDALTVGTTEGPYYVTGTPELKDGELNYAALPGEPVSVSGHVYGGVGSSKPLAGAKIEIWHADSSGSYHPNAPGDAAHLPPGQLALRGYVVTDAEGRYHFTSIYPGIYPWRCRHFHVRASAAPYGGVVTQLIVPAKPGDHTTPDEDFVARALPAVNRLTFQRQGDILASVFDFHLAAD